MDNPDNNIYNNNDNYTLHIIIIIIIFNFHSFNREMFKLNKVKTYLHSPSNGTKYSVNIAGIQIKFI